MVESIHKGFKKRELFYSFGLWLLSLLIPDPQLHYRREYRFRKRDLLYLMGLTALPMIWPDPHVLHLLVLAGIHGIVALGLGLFLGYAGQISLGQAAFFGIGAYTTAILTTRLSLPSPFALLASGLAASLFAFLIGKPLLKLKGYFLALATLGFGEIFLVLVRESPSLTGGVIGIFGIPFFSVVGFTFDSYLKQYYLSWGILAGLVVFCKNLVRSKMGRAFLAVASSEDGASSVGIDVARVKLGVFVTAAAFAGLAGSLFASVMSTASPETFSLNLSVLFVMMVILGGMGNLYGPIAGAIFLTFLTDALGRYQEFSLPLYGLILILLLVFFPEGLGSRLRGRLIYLISYFGRKKRREKVDL
ncbi:MAG: branched-chain amino acid ABC transporter permease [Desulfobacterota bacterium]|nr:branched-chain amino acid ABC transporter permease [Thermodesulfobacteriota bacterium]